jgi:pimeloyl-ACP methyl ester carboxylesterase
MGLKVRVKMNVVVNKANLYYEIHGRGEPLLMLQGWGMDITGWQYIIEPLSQMFQIIVLDNRGTGRSEVTPGKYTTRLLADDAAALLAHLQIDKAHVLGWSMGGMIAQELVLAYPQKVNRLILSASSAKVSAKSSFIAWSNIEALNRGEFHTSVNWQLSFCFSKAVFANEELLSAIKEGALNPPYPVTLAGLISQFAAVDSHDRRKQLRRIKSPTLVLGAAEDGIIDIDQVKALAREIDNSELRILPGGHMYHIEHSDLFARTVIEFLADSTSAGNEEYGIMIGAPFS